MKIFHFKRIAAIAAIAAALLASCNKDEVITETNPQPPVIILDNDTGVYTIKSGRTLQIEPSYENADKALYVWSADGKIIGDTPSLTFVGDATGPVYVTLAVSTRYGTAAEELRIDVVELEIPTISLPGAEGGYRILTGKPLTLNPIIPETSLPTDCRWYVDGTQVATEQNYIFVSAEKGTYSLRFETSNEDGSDSLEFTVQVCTPDEMPFGWTFDQTVYNTSLGRTIRLVPFDIENDFEVTYTWTVSGPGVDASKPLQQGTDPQLRFTPATTGTYTATVTAESPYFEAQSRTLTVHVFAANATRRAADASSSPYDTKVFEVLPAPGQFVGQITSGRTMEEACAAAEKVFSGVGYISLGGYGGRVVVGFDHSIENRGGYDFAIQGNSFTNSSEPGIVWVMQDENGNGLPDDTWYELKGSEYGKPETISDYAVTYYRPKNNGLPVAWKDNLGNSGSISLNPTYPAWVDTDTYTLRGTRLNARNEDTSGGGTYWVNRDYDWGYADNYSLIDRLTNDGYNYFRISDAVTFDGQAADLPYIDFVKVQVGVNATSGWIGEISTEVLGFKDYNLEQSK